MDLISREEAIKAVINHLQLDREYAWGVREAINGLPSAQRWVPVSEKLPEECGWYITTTTGKCVTFRWYSTLHGFETHQDEIFAYMPLPEPYKEER